MKRFLGLIFAITIIAGDCAALPKQNFSNPHEFSSDRKKEAFRKEFEEVRTILFPVLAVIGLYGVYWIQTSNCCH